MGFGCTLHNLIKYIGNPHIFDPQCLKITKNVSFEFFAPKMTVFLIFKYLNFGAKNSKLLVRNKV